MSPFRWKVLFLAILMNAAIAAQQVVAEDKQQEGEALLTRAQQLLELRAPGNPAFRLTAQFRLMDRQLGNLEGSYEETWVSPDQWRREIKAGNYHQIEIGNGKKHWALELRSPDVTAFDHVRPQLALTAAAFTRPKIKKIHNENIAGVAARCMHVKDTGFVDETLCLDAASGVLLSEYGLGGKASRTEYSDYATFGGHSYARKVREFEEGKLSRELTISELAAEPAPDPSLFVPTAGLREAPGCQAPTRPQPVVSPAPPPPSRASRGGGQVILWVVIEADGKVSDARVVRTSGDDQYDAGALETVRRWQFKAATCDGQPVPIAINIMIDSHVL